MSKEVKPLVFGVNYEPFADDMGLNLGAPIPASIILTRSELQKMIADAFEAGADSGFEQGWAEGQNISARPKFKSKQKYIDSILKNNQ